MKRRRVHNRERLELFKREKGICHLCNGLIQAGEAWDLSHEIELELGGADDPSNWRVAHHKCHLSHTGKSSIPLIAKMRRREIAHLGAKAPPRKPIQSRGFAPAAPKDRTLKKELPARKPMFEEVKR